MMQLVLEFRSRIKAQHSSRNPSFVLSAEEAVRAVFTGDAQGLREARLRGLRKYVSVRDFATRAPAENDYQGLMTGVFGSVEDRDLANLESNG